MECLCHSLVPPRAHQGLGAFFLSQGSFLMPWNSDAILHHSINNVDGAMMEKRCQE